MSSPLPVVQYLVGFNNGPMDDPALITTVATPAGTLGANNVWTDITPWVDSHKITRGRQHELQQFEAGTCELHLNNVDARFNPWNASGPYFGLLLPRKLLQVRAVWGGVTYTRFTGHVDAWPVEWPDPISGFASVHATDAFRLFNLNNITSTGYPAQVVADGATAYWRLGDPIGSSTAANVVSPTKYGTYVGTNSLGQTGALVADPNTSANFAPNSNTPSGVVNVPAIGGPFSAASTFTVEAWVSSPTWSKPVLGQNYVYINTNAGGAAIWLYVNSTGLPQMVLQDAAGHFKTAASASTTIPADSSWHHLVGTYNGTTVAIYIDGVSVAGATTTSGVVGSWTPTFGGIAGDTPVDGNLWAGNLQDVAFYATTALSGATVLNHYNLGAFSQQATDVRLGRVLDVVGWSSTARNLDSGTSTVQAVTSALTSTSSLSHMQQVEATESGALFMTTAGKVRFVSRQNLLSQAVYTAPQQTIGDNTAGGDMPFQPGPVIALDDIDLYNEAIAQRQNGLTQRATDSGSITTYGRVTWQPPASLVGVSDIEVLSLAQYIVSKYAAPVVRVQSVTVNLLELITPNLVSHLFALDLLYRITVERTSMPGGGTGFSQVANIEHIEEDVTPDSWTVTFGLAIADPGWWILGTGALGSTTRIAF